VSGGIRHILYTGCRSASRTACGIPRSTAPGGGPSGYGAGKKVKGRRMRLTVDASGTPAVMAVTSSGIQDRDGGPEDGREAAWDRTDGGQAGR